MHRFVVLLLLFACSHPDPNGTIAAANELTQRYANKNLQAFAGGSDCQVLLIRSDTGLDHAAVESIHYAAGQYGAEQFAADRKFRAVVYRDGKGGLWTYGSTTREEAAALPLCR